MNHNILKLNALNKTSLNTRRLESVRNETGKAYYNLGAKTAKHWSPAFDELRGTVSLLYEFRSDLPGI